jgi:hypothetical protein
MQKNLATILEPEQAQTLASCLHAFILGFPELSRIRFSAWFAPPCICVLQTCQPGKCQADQRLQCFSQKKGHVVLSFFPKKLNIVFIFADAIAMAFAISAPAQQLATPQPQDTATTAATKRIVSPRDVVKIGDFYIEKWTGVQTGKPVLGLGGDRALLEQMIPILACDFYGQLDIQFVSDPPANHKGVYARLISGETREFTKGELTEQEVATLVKGLQSRNCQSDALEKWRTGELTWHLIELWLRKTTGLLSNKSVLPELTENEFQATLTAKKPYELVFYRSKEALDKLDPSVRQVIWQLQEEELAQVALKAAQLSPFLNVRMTSSDTRFGEDKLYDLFAPGCQWQGHLVGVLLRGSKDPSLRRKGVPISTPPVDGKTFADGLEQKILTSLGLENLLPAAKKHAQATSPTSPPGATAPAKPPGSKQ